MVEVRVRDHPDESHHHHFPTQKVATVLVRRRVHIREHGPIEEVRRELGQACPGAEEGYGV
jgi:hypothetical protein